MSKQAKPYTPMGHDDGERSPEHYCPKCAKPKPCSAHKPQAVKPSLVALPFQQVKNSVYDANGKCVSDGRWGNPERNAQNAALIVKAVNAHDGMVKLLSRILGMHETNNCGAYNGEAILSESVADEIRHTLRGINGR